MSKESGKKILLSGVKPTGTVHIGNYFGAMKQFVDLQDKYDCYVFIADYHAMTTVQDRSELSKGIIDVALDYLAIGLDPDQHELPVDRLALLEIGDIDDVDQFAELVDAKIERRIITHEDGGDARQRRIVSRGDIERINVEAAAGKHAGNARQNPELVLNED